MKNSNVRNDKMYIHNNGKTILRIRNHKNEEYGGGRSGKKKTESEGLARRNKMKEEGRGRRMMKKNEE